jgi:hypothetical protein
LDYLPGPCLQRPRAEVQQAEDNRPDAVAERVAGRAPDALDADMNEHRPEEAEEQATADPDPDSHSGSPFATRTTRGQAEHKQEEHQQVQED